MSTLTIKKFPEILLARLKEKAVASRRSVTQEVLARLEASLHERESERNQISHAEGERQARAWEGMAAKWKSNLSVHEEIKQLYKARTRGRKVKM
jgi:plasmid stability protein